MLNLYANPISPFAAKVHYFLEETATPYAYHALNLRDPAARATLTAVNPFTKVPAIELNGFTLGESNAILRYLAARGEHWNLYPVNLEDRANVDQMLEFTLVHVARPILSLAWNLYWAPKLGMPSDDYAVQEAQSTLPGMLGRLELAMAGQTYLAGADLTLADIALTPYAAQLPHAQVSLSDFPQIQAWSERVLQRPAWKRTSADIERRIGEVLGRS